jgi:MYXO-CTERM domain-containing protein
MTKLTKLMAIAVLGCGAISAQQQPATSSEPDGRAQTATTRQDAAPRRESNWGWIGLLGLAGLAGLRGRRDTRVVTEDDRARSGPRRVA